MATSRIAITIDESTLSRLDRLVRERKYPNRSRAIQEALQEKLERIERGRLAEECAKLDANQEKAFAEEGLGFEVEEWPEY